MIFNENIDEQNIPMFVRGGESRNSQEACPDEYWQSSAELEDPEMEMLPVHWDPADAVETSYFTTANDVTSQDLDCINLNMDCGVDNKRVPNTVREARSSPEWTAAYNREIQSFVDNDILEFVPRENGMKVLVWRWMFEL